MGCMDVQGAVRSTPCVHSPLRWQGTSVKEQMVLLLVPNTSSLSEHLSDRWAQDPGPS